MQNSFLTARQYRKSMKYENLISFRISEEESDLHIQAENNLYRSAHKKLLKLRKELKEYIAKNPGFKESLKPWPEDALAPSLIKSMIEAGKIAETGPMAAVAGAIAEAVGKKLLLRSKEVIVENGGDIFALTKKDLKFGVYAGKSPFTGRIALKIPAPVEGIGICTSSGSFGHSLSFGKADAGIVVTKDTAIADALATAITNKVKSEDDIDVLIERAKDFPMIKALVLIMGKKLALYGEIEILPVK